MNGRQSPSEERIGRLQAARAWLRAHGFAIKTNLIVSPPVPRYQLTGVPGLMTADELVDFAARRGWAP